MTATAQERSCKSRVSGTYLGCFAGQTATPGHESDRAILPLYSRNDKPRRYVHRGADACASLIPLSAEGDDVYCKRRGTENPVIHFLATQRPNQFIVAQKGLTASRNRHINTAVRMEPLQESAEQL